MHFHSDYFGWYDLVFFRGRQNVGASSSFRRTLEIFLVRPFVRSFVRNWKRRKKAEIPAHTCTQEHRGGEREERGSFKFFRKMNAPGSRRVKLQKFRTLYSLPMTNEGRTYSFTLQKSPWLINAPPLPPLSLPARLFSPPCPHYYSFFSILFPLVHTRSDAFARTCEFNRLLYIHIYIYGILKVNRSMFSNLSRFKKKKKKFPWNFTLPAQHR